MKGKIEKKAIGSTSRAKHRSRIWRTGRGRSFCETFGGVAIIVLSLLFSWLEDVFLDCVLVADSLLAEVASAAWTSAVGAWFPPASSGVLSDAIVSLLLPSFCSRIDFISPEWSDAYRLAIIKFQLREKRTNVKPSY